MIFVLAIIMLMFIAGVAVGISIKLAGFFVCAFAIVGMLVLLRMML